MEPLIASTPAHDAFVAYVHDLQERIVAGLGEVEPAPFERRAWSRDGLGGGGRMRLVRGEVLEKGAVHTSAVHGATNPLTSRPFHAAGLSLILHPTSPHAPTVHLNVRHFHEEGGGWWGGGMDLTPMGVWHDEDVRAFHDALRAALGERYEEGRKQAEEYFFVPHRGRERGAGGVFYDHAHPGDDEAGFALARAIGDAFLGAYLPILRRRGRQAWTPEEREMQLVDRGVYVEFNLLYDRGTRFGFQSGGNPEAILSSLPPLVRW